MLTKKKIEEKAEGLEWKVTWKDQDKRLKFVQFEAYTDKGQDIIIEIDYEKLCEIKEKIYEQYTDFDVSEQTAMWIDSSGHGKNGAPYDIEDIVKDMKQAENMILNLSENIRDIERKNH